LVRACREPAGRHYGEAAVARTTLSFKFNRTVAPGRAFGVYSAPHEIVRRTPIAGQKGVISKG